MIRVIVAVIGLLILWMWLATKLKQNAKIVVSVTAFALIVGLLAYDSYRSTPRTGVAIPEQILLCGLKVEHHYRSDYKLSLCFENTSEAALVRRLKFDVVASLEMDGEQQSLINTRDLAVNIKAGELSRIEDIVTFKQLDPAFMDDVSWSVKIQAVKALTQ